MSIRTTVTLDDDVFSRLKEVSASRGIPFRDMLNEAVRSGLTAMQTRPKRERYKIHAVDLGPPKVPNLDDIAAVIERGATLASTDRDFSRFSGLPWINPLA